MVGLNAISVKLHFTVKWLIVYPVVWPFLIPRGFLGRKILFEKNIVAFTCRKCKWEPKINGRIDTLNNITGK